MIDLEQDQETALARFESLVRMVDEPLGLARAAAATATFAFPDVDEQQVANLLDALAQQVAKLGTSRTVDASLASLNYVLFVECGFRAIPAGQCRPSHAMLHLGLMTQHASAGTLALIYHLVAQRLGLSTRPVWCQGRLLVAVSAGARDWLIDPSRAGDMIGEIDSHPVSNQTPGTQLVWLDFVHRELAELFGKLGALEDQRVVLMMKQRVGNFPSNPR